MKHKVSIIVPVHNTQDYVEACVNSLLLQSLEDIEIILVENCSTDASLEVCRRIAAKHSGKVRLLQSDVPDLSTARNVGVAAARSEYVAFVDSDDTVDIVMYEKMYTLAAEQNLDLVYCNHVMLYEDKAPKYAFSEDGSNRVMSPKEMLMMVFTHRINSNACTMLVRRSLFDNLRFPEKMSFEDRAFTFLLIDSSKRVGYINKAFYNYYQRSGSICHTMSWKRYYDFAESDRRRLQYIKDSPLFSDEERKVAASKSADSIIRRLRHLHSMAKTPEEKELSRYMSRHLSLIPKGCSISMKARLFRRFIRAFYI